MPTPQNTTPDTPLYDGQKSVLGKQWLMKQCDGRHALMLSQRHDLHPLLGRILSMRGITDDDVPQFLNPKIRDFMPDPTTIARMADAVDAIMPLIQNGGCVGILGDYDVDGATSTALLSTVLRKLGVTVHTHIPNRHTEGYGPNITALKSLHNQGAELVFTLDCGVTAFETLEQAQQSNIPIIVLDHHQSEPHLPPAVAVVNPNCLDDTSGLGDLAAVGVVYMFVVALNSRLKTDLPEHALSGAELLNYLDWVALGTVCDLVPLHGLNRAFVTQGLRVMQNRQNLGLTTLCDVAGVNTAPTPYHLGFLLGPRINAGGRLGQSDLGLNLLCANDPVVAKDIATQMNTLNTERQAIEQHCRDQATEQIEQGKTSQTAPALSPYLACVAHPDWNSGVVGIVAGRLKDTYNRPACVIAVEQDENGNLIGKGSGRSVRGVDLGTAIISARQQGLLLAGGGHAMAGGFSVDMNQYDDFVNYLNTHIAGQLNGGDITPTLTIDGTIPVSGATLDFVKTLADLEPYGMGNPEPRFVLENVRITHAEIVKETHIRFTAKDDTNATINGMAFSCIDNAMGQTLINAKTTNQWLNITGKIRLNTWQGRETIQLLPDDVMVIQN